jgi:hypothetical protein
MKLKKGLTNEELRKLLPTRYHDFIDICSQKGADTLPPHRPDDHAINIEQGKMPPYKRPYPMSKDELLVVKKYIDEHLDKGFIRPSMSPAAAPILLAKKPGGGIRFCVDYRGLNAITIKNRYPVPLIRETLERLSQAKIYTKLDIIAAFNHLRIREGDEWKTAFASRFGQFEYTVMPFGVCNATLITPYGTTSTTSALHTWTTYLFTAMTLLSIPNTFERSYSALGTQDFTSI